jgi:phosphoribosylaminoimidazole-succinocarboxamide synthase
MARNVVVQTDFKDIPLRKRGKIRDVYDLGETLLIVATDRISAFDVVMPNPIPDKGMVLTQISRFWFDATKDIIPNHLISTEVEDFPEVCKPYREILAGRTMWVKKTDPLPVECVVRGYLSGSGWGDYQARGEVCGITLPTGLVESSQLEEPIFTPATKAEAGDHDENISFKQVGEIIGKERAEGVKTISISIYRRACQLAEVKGIIIADTKFEFGISGGKLLLIDEVLTPDSSRFWPKDEYRPGGPQRSFDKQFLRDYLLSLDWDKAPPAPQLPQEIIEKTRERYLEALKRLTD